MLKRYNSLKMFRPVEVIVVVLVLLSLIAVVSVVCRKVRFGAAARATCAQNLSVIGKAIMSYANDNDGRLPRSGGSSSYYGETPIWRGAAKRKSCYLIYRRA